MDKHLVSINDLSPDGKEFRLNDQEIWLEPAKEFNMDCKILEPLEARIAVQPVDEGILVQGEIRGLVAVPCNRCTEDADVRIDATFSEYEEIPPEPSGRDADTDGCIVYERHRPMLDLSRVCWEQFQLALPVQPLCSTDCKGLCPQCGANLNQSPCACATEPVDSRMAALRDVRVLKK